MQTMTPNPVPSIPSREAVELMQERLQALYHRSGTHPTSMQEADDMLGELLAEVERLTAKQCTLFSCNGKAEAYDLRATVAAQAAELEKVRKDAERYRWARLNPVKCANFADDQTYRYRRDQPELFDAAIDAALGNSSQSASQMDAPRGKG
jgi:hypothetical protein